MVVVVERVKKCIRVLLYTHTWPVLALHLMTAADEKADIFVLLCCAGLVRAQGPKTCMHLPAAAIVHILLMRAQKEKNQTSSLSLKVHISPSILHSTEGHILVEIDPPPSTTY